MSEHNGYTLAIEEWNSKGGVNGKKVKLLVEDTNTSMQKIMSSFQFISQKGVNYILGPTWLDGFPAVIQPAKKKEILLISPSVAIEALSPSDASWPIVFYYNTTIEVNKLMDALSQKGLKRVAMLYELEPYAETLSKLVNQNKPKDFLEIGVQGNTADFNSILNKVKSFNPDVLLVFVWSETALHALLKQARIYIPNVMLASVNGAEPWTKTPTFSNYIK